MSIWLFTLRQPEELFWETMTPARLIALYDAYLGKGPGRPVSDSDTAEEPMGLYSAIREMGGL